MDYFEAIAASSFITNDRGQRIFFPWGPLGKGYVVPTDDEYERLRVALVRSFRTVRPLGLLLVLSWLWMPWTVDCALAFLFFFGYAFWLRTVTSGWSQSAERLSFGRNVSNHPLSHHRSRLWLMLLGALALAAAGVWLIVDLHTWRAGVPSIAFFGFCAVVLSRMLVVQRRISKSGGMEQR